MQVLDHRYLATVEDILGEGMPKKDRTGVGTRSSFGHTFSHRMADGFPLLTTKKIHFKSVKGELLWFLSGSTNAKTLRDKYEVTIWDEWAAENGELGPIYGKQWTDWKGVDTGGLPVVANQIQMAIDQLKTNPDSRRIIVNAWNVAQIHEMALPPCHVMFQFYSFDKEGNRYLSLSWYQRSVDVGLGLPFNIASYGLLLEMVAQQVGMIPYELIGMFGDVHIYENHIEALSTQLSRDPTRYQLPKLELNKAKDIFSYKMNDIKLIGYEAYPHIKMDVAV